MKRLSFIKELTETDKVVVILSLILIGAGIVLRGIAAQGAITAISAVVGLIFLLSYSKWLTRITIKIFPYLDVVLSIGTLAAGFLTGKATLVVLCLYLGITVSAVGRVARAIYRSKEKQKELENTRKVLQFPIKEKKDEVGSK